MKLLAILLLTVAAVSAAPRSATRVQPVTAHITSLTDKDARSKARVHPAFANAGRVAGVEVWRIQDFDPVAVSAADFGKFYKGDSYIVLKTTADKRNNLSWNIYYWIGSESTQDESGAAAILTVGLDDKFNGAAIQHREVLGQESQDFKALFPSGLQYLSGGHASGFNHVVTNAGAEKRLIQVKGKRNIRTRQVDPLISSMNKGDCFILDIGNEVYVYVGEGTRNMEKLKAISVANQIRDQDHNGRARVEIVDQYSNDVDTQKFFTALGSGTKDLVPEASAGGDDQAFERNEEQAIVLSEVSDSTGKVKVTALSKPYRQEQLKPQEAYILDTVTGSIYVWTGRQATEREKTEAMTKAQQLLSSKNYASWVKVVKIPQGTEPAIFKQYFATWRDLGMSHTRIV
ncbi:gelsolin-like [Spodoptera frugiperda]|uniref:Gelsolin-like n=1 Tax=Spodoptera frugiperda TaxID=7108 RepID=A0A9R0E138_SPOFR|nr:gelsolin-like [Spodoptera frugiperda]